MILTIIILILTLGFVMLFLGYWIKVPFVVMMGWILLFLLFINLLSNPIEYKTGTEETYNYGSNFTNSLHWDIEHPSTAPTFNPSTDPIFLFHITEMDTYSEYTNNIIFIYLSIISGLGFVSVFFTKDLW